MELGERGEWIKCWACGHGRETRDKQGSQCLPLFHFHPSLTLTLSQVAVNALLANLLLPVLAHPSAIRTSPTIVLVIGTLAVPLASTRMGKDETIFIAKTDDMTPGITNLISGTEETMAATALATMTMVAMRDIFATVVVILKKGMTVDATNVVTMTVTVDAIAHRVDLGVEGEMSDHGHPVVVHVRFLNSGHILSIPNLYL